MAIIRTTLDLYRAGNKSGPRMEHFSQGEIVIQVRSGVDWVLGPQQGGASTKDAPVGLRGTWYILPAGSPFDDSFLYLWNDYADHWSWEPAQDMLLNAYLDVLRALNRSFKPLSVAPGGIATPPAP
jgi:hypothetical protein